MPKISKIKKNQINEKKRNSKLQEFETIFKNMGPEERQHFFVRALQSENKIEVSDEELNLQALFLREALEISDFGRKSFTEKDIEKRLKEKGLWKEDDDQS